jgi:hypothetical protein
MRDGWYCFVVGLGRYVDIGGIVDNHCLSFLRIWVSVIKCFVVQRVFHLRRFRIYI